MSIDDYFEYLSELNRGEMIALIGLCKGWSRIKTAERTSYTYSAVRTNLSMAYQKLGFNLIEDDEKRSMVLHRYFCPELRRIILSSQDYEDFRKIIEDENESQYYEQIIENEEKRGVERETEGNEEELGIDEPGIIDNKSVDQEEETDKDDADIPEEIDHECADEETQENDKTPDTIDPEVEGMIEKDENAIQILNAEVIEMVPRPIQIPPEPIPPTRRTPWRLIITILIIGMCLGAGVLYLGIQVFRRQTDEPISLSLTTPEEITDEDISTPILTPTPETQLMEPGFIFEDDFEAGPDPAWEVISGEVGWINGRYTVTQPFDGVKTEHFSILSDMYWKNVAVSIKVESYKRVMTGTDGSGGIIVGYDNQGDAIGLIYYPGNRGMVLAKLKPGRKWESIQGTNAGGSNFLNGANVIKVEVIGDLIYVYFNDQGITSWQMPEIKIGQVGLWFKTNSAYSSIDTYSPRIDWIKIEALPDQ